MRPRQSRRGITYHELGFNRDLRNILLALLDLTNQRLRRDLSHSQQRLPHRRQSWICKRRPRNVIESHDRNILRHSQSRLAKCPYRSNRGNIVVRKERRKGLPPREQLLRYREPYFRSGNLALDSYRQLRSNSNPQLHRHPTNRIPALLGIRAENLPLQERNPLMAQFFEVLKSKPRRPFVVEHN